MVNWQITAKTVFCNSVSDEVTLMVYKDGSAKCSGYNKYTHATQATEKILRAKSRQLKRPLKCDFSTCPYLSEYKDRVFKEEDGEPESTNN